VKFRLPRFRANTIRKEAPDVIANRNFGGLSSVLEAAFGLVEGWMEDLEKSILTKAQILGMIRQRTGSFDMGNVLVAGTVTVSNTSVTANTMFSWNRVVSGGTLGDITITRSAGVGYTITSSSASETSTIDVMLIEAT
jgi:hypothetical protein